MHLTIEAVFFDLGDTISELREGEESYILRVRQRGERVYEALVAAGASLPERELFAAALADATEAHYQAALAEERGTTVYAAMRAFLPAMGLPATDALVAAAGDAYCRPGQTALPLRLGARETLAALKARGLALGVISNTLQPAGYMNAVLARQGIRQFFDACIYSSEVGRAKPHPAIFRAALAALGAPPERAVHVGDRLAADVRGAQGAGMKAVLIEVTHRTEPDDHVTPDARIAELPELLDVIARL
jgi:putative hydrolase of the HAD superfamily